MSHEKKGHTSVVTYNQHRQYIQNKEPYSDEKMKHWCLGGHENYVTYPQL